MHICRKDQPAAAVLMTKGNHCMVDCAAAPRENALARDCTLCAHQEGNDFVAR